MEIGNHVTYVDQLGQEHNALICQVWSADPENDPTPSLNLVYVSDDESKTDQYGRQIQREATSVVHESNQYAHGRKWRNS